MSSDGTQGSVIVKGVPADDPRNPPVRMEVRDMIKNQPDQWNLYLLGMERFKSEAVPENMPLSYFELAGIHGRPFKKWPDQPWNDKMVNVGGRFGGFCTHSSILFLTWHRPYLALFEESGMFTELYKHVNAVANEFAESERKADYVKAAKNFRMPYWDWARPDLGVFPPQAASRARNKVTRPKSQPGPAEINPLGSYMFRESKNIQNINMFGGSTVRYPENPNAAARDNDVREALLALFEGRDQTPKGKNLTERVQFILQSYKEFKTASSNRFFPPNNKPGPIDFTAWGSIEDIHNVIHVYIGGRGQMSNPAVAAFDPIFWLHHTNIDRLFAIWQAIHDNPNDPSTYVTDQKTDQFGTNWWSREGDPETIKTPLLPFAQSGTKEKQNFWTSEGARYTNTFGYVYPETQKSKFPTPKDVVNELDRLYGKMASLANIMRSSGADLQNSTEVLQNRARTHLKVERGLASAAAVTEQAPMSTTNGVNLPADRDLKKLVGPNKTYLEWLVDIRAEKAEVDGNYIVHVFLGDPDDQNPALYVSNHSHVSAFSTFGQDENTACQNCQEGRAAGLQITGQIPITLALVERYLAGLVGSLQPEDVIPYLQKNLHWRATLPSGDIVDRRELQNLLVSVVTNEATVPDSPTDLPRYADNVVVRAEATTNREGAGRGHGTGYCPNYQGSTA